MRRLLADPAVTVMVAGHRDRPGRVNSGLAGAARSARDRRLVVLEDSEVVGDLMPDMAEVLTLFCAGLHDAGRRGTGP